MKIATLKLSRWKSATAVCLFYAATAIAAHAQTFTTIATLRYPDGSFPRAISQGTNGNLYGVASGGGSYGHGTAFEISPNGKLVVFYSFCPQFGCADGNAPVSLMQASNGDFYGITDLGGSACVVGLLGCGTLFKITPAGEETALYDFCSQTYCRTSQGQVADPVLVQGINGRLFGATVVGGRSNKVVCGGTCGTIFEMTLSGELTTLYGFCSQPNCTDGAYPLGLVEGTDGNIYGTTGTGGANGWGTFFVITPTGTLTTLHSFQYAYGFAPTLSVQGTDGDFYGTVPEANTSAGGSVVRITASGEVSTLHTFCAEPCLEGAGPESLVQGNDGNFYGITTFGGGSTNYLCRRGGCGTIFEITPSGQLTTLYNFCSQANCTDGRAPTSLMQGTDGILYGTTGQGGCPNGKTGCGTVFSLSLKLGPFVKANPAFGKVGYNISILGNNLTGTTSVTFNGKPATFTVKSGSFIKATVPTGATTGRIEVSTPSGTLSSNIDFQVWP